MRFWLRVALCIANILTCCALARASPIGGPEHRSDTDSCCSWSSSIEPVSAILTTAAQTDYLRNGLDVAGFKPSDWDIEYRHLTGAITITAYYAWVTNYPTLNCGSLTVNDPQPTVKRRGGAVFCLDYSPGNGDPTGGAVHWIQAVKTDFDPRSLFPLISDPPIFNSADGTFHFLDNGFSSENPYYDSAGGAANSTHFLDVPYQVCQTSPTAPIVSGGTVEFSVFVAGFEERPSGNVAAVLYSDGYRWGYHFSCSPLLAAPEPNTLVLTACGGAGFLLCAWRFRRNARAGRNGSTVK